jgi:nicotinate-nucleotide pyrophosphorylase (carboxylating)
VAAVAAVRSAAKKAGREVLVEASGGITLTRARGMRASGVDRVSTSALTFGVSVIDFGLDEAADEGGGL